MKTITQPLRDEHQELYPEIESLWVAGDAIRETLLPADRAQINRAYAFLTHHLLPHAQAEEAALYPAVRKVMGAPSGTATMARDHVEVHRLTEELGTLRDGIHDGRLTPEQIYGLRRVLYGLYALVKVHFAKEEEVYLPLLDAGLTEQDAKAMFESMEQAAHRAKAAADRVAN